MEWDLGVQGVLLLLAMSFGCGVVAQLVLWRVTPHWFWLFATAIFFVTGVLISEVLFGWATEEELQPNIDGLSFDEVLLFLMLAGAVLALVTWLVSRRVRARH
jgi:hypothetical protein